MALLSHVLNSNNVRLKKAANNQFQHRALKEDSSFSSLFICKSPTADYIIHVVSTSLRQNHPQPMQNQGYLPAEYAR